MQFSVSLYIHILPHKKNWDQSKLLKYRNNSQKLSRSLENWPKSIKIRISLCFLIKSLPNAFGKDLVKKQRKILMMINFGGCEGVSANYFDILKASIAFKFFCEQGYGCVGWPKIALEWFQGVIFHFPNFWIFLLHYFADLLLNFLASESFRFFLSSSVRRTSTTIGPGHWFYY